MCGAVKAQQERSTAQAVKGCRIGLQVGAAAWKGRNDLDFYNESNLFDICGNCAHSRYLQDEPYGDTYISGWYCDEWLSLVDYDDTCKKYESEE